MKSSVSSTATRASKCQLKTNHQGAEPLTDASAFRTLEITEAAAASSAQKDFELKAFKIDCPREQVSFSFSLLPHLPLANFLFFFFLSFFSFLFFFSLLRRGRRGLSELA
jgi:hypothetical protein